MQLLSWLLTSQQNHFFYGVYISLTLWWFILSHILIFISVNTFVFWTLDEDSQKFPGLSPLLLETAQLDCMCLALVKKSQSVPATTSLFRSSCPKSFMFVYILLKFKWNHCCIVTGLAKKYFLPFLNADFWRLNLLIVLFSCCSASSHCMG